MRAAARSLSFVLLALAVVTVIGQWPHQDASLTAVPPAAAPQAVSAKASPVWRRTAAVPAQPLVFEENLGQAQADLKFIARSRGLAVGVAAEGPQFRWPGQIAVVALRFAGAKPGELKSLEPKRGRAHYYRGSDPRNWVVGARTFGRIRAAAIWPGIDVEYYGRDGALEYDFVVAPGADPQLIRLEFASEGNQAPLAIATDGVLVVSTGAGELRMQPPVAYQTGPLGREPVEAQFALREGAAEFRLAAYDRKRPLVIDPVLSYSTYLGGRHHDGASAIAADADGNVYVAGFSSSDDFPADAPHSGGAFVSKFDPSGAELLYSVLLGGTAVELANGLALDADGNAYIAGHIDMQGATPDGGGFPLLNPFQPTYGGGGREGFVAKIDSDGVLVYSSYLGGSADDVIRGIAVDSAGNAYVAGSSNSGNYPTTAGAYRTAVVFNPGQSAVVVTKIAAAGDSMAYSTFISGEGANAFGTDIAVDANGHAFVTGQGGGPAFPTTPGAFQTPSGAHADAFVTKLSADGAQLIYSTMLGGASHDIGRHIAINTAGEAYVCGATPSTDFPTVSPFQAASAGGMDVFVAKFNAAGTALLASSYLGGSGNDGTIDGTGDLAIDAAGNIYVVGQTLSTNFPLVDPVQDTFAGGDLRGDVFVTFIKADFSALTFSTYLGGDLDDWGGGAALAPDGSVLAAGSAGPNLPLVTPFQAEYDDSVGGGDGFWARFSQTLELSAAKDTFLRSGSDNTNEGANPYLRLQSSGHNRAVVEFDLAEVATLPTKATLVLTIAENGNNWGQTGRNLQVHPLAATFAEGNGINSEVPNAQRFRGTGDGATWNTAVDTNIANQQQNGPDWDGAGDVAPASPTDVVLIANQQTGVLEFDVTDDVLAALVGNADSAGWLLRKELEGQAGHVNFWSREGAAVQANPSLAPRLILSFGAP